ncbi:haloacid dehalogenase type II [Falsiroseomonas sp.]|uniref:haloacid dehalogenase type II n=1 Tax=Falsiroseomonas sp. TaxID=2870721 RepID=UPI0034A54879
MPADAVPPPTAVVFDAYGTLLDVHAAVTRHAARLGPAAAAVSAMWRQRQFEYSWILSATGAYEDFAAITARALDVTLAAHGLTDEALREDLLAAYRRLDAFPDALPVLSGLRRAGRRIGILSNGSPAMLAEAVREAGLAPVLDAVLSVDTRRLYKPHRQVYELAPAQFGCAPDRIAFVSGNAWDAFGAARFGFRVFWLNRTPQPEEYGLATLAERRIASLSELPALLA